VGNTTDALKILSYPAVAVRGLQRGYWPVLVLLSSILIACASDPPQTLEVEEQVSAAPSEIPTMQASSREVLSSSPPTLLLRSFYRIRDVGMYPGMEESLTTRLAQCVPELFEDLPPSSRPISVPVEISDFLEDHRIWHLAHNLLFIAHWDNESKKWFVLDVGGEFTTDQLTMPPGQVPPAPREVRELTRLESGKVYDFRMRWKGNVDLMGQRSDDWFFHAGSNFIVWP